MVYELRNTKGVLIEQSKAHKQVQQAKGWPTNKEKRREMLKECLLSNQKRKNMHNQLKDGNKQEKTQTNAKGELKPFLWRS